MSILDDMAALVREAGQIVLSARDIWAHTHEKTSAADLVTEYDEAVEAFLKERLPKLLPGSQFFGEEEAENCDPSRGWVFIVDPIDGTTNFVRGIPQSAISVALAHDGQVEYAVVYDPFKDELFSASRGGGAFRNGSPIHVSTLPLSQGIFGMGTAIYKRENIAPTMRLTEQLMNRSCDFRRLGAAPWTCATWPAAGQRCSSNTVSAPGTTPPAASSSPRREAMCPLWRALPCPLPSAAPSGPATT